MEKGIKTILVKDIIGSKVADDDQKGNIIFNTIDEEKNKYDTIVLDFMNIELVNTAFFNNAIGALFDGRRFDLSKCKIIVRNLDETKEEVMKESILAARQKYNLYYNQESRHDY